MKSLSLVLDLAGIGCQICYILAITFQTVGTSEFCLNESELSLDYVGM